MISALLGWPTRVANDDARPQHSCKASLPSMSAEGSSAWPGLHNLQTHIIDLLDTHSPLLPWYAPALIIDWPCIRTLQH